MVCGDWLAVFSLLVRKKQMKCRFALEASTIRHSGLQGRPDDGGIRLGQCDNFVFVTNNQLLPFLQSIGRRIWTDVDVQNLAAIGQWKLQR
jgi:hypothetical protein